MKSTGIVRKIDNLGRVVLPIELRRVLNLNVQDEIEIFVNQNQIILEKYSPDHCVFCGTTNDLVEHAEKHICRNCKAALNKM